MIKAEDHIGTVCGSGIGLTEDSIDALQAESEIYQNKSFVTFDAMKANNYQG